MDMEQQELEQEINLMPFHQEVDPLASPDLEAEKVPTNQGDNDILGNNLKEEMHNTLVDESQHRVVQSHRVSTPDDNTSPMQFEEQVIMSNVCKHLVALADATRAYVEAIRLSVHFLIVENELMAKELQTTKQG